MSLQLVLGGSGSGKSDHVYEEILRRSKEAPDKLFFVIVPEQFTMQTQRELVRRQERHGIMNVDVVSFQRLAYRVFDELGAGGTRVLGEIGKNLLLRRVAEEQQENLLLLKSGMKKTGYISKMKSILSELAQYRITPGQLDVFVEDESQSPLFRYKIRDIQTMYQGFMDFLRGKFITAEEILDVLERLAPQSGLLRHSVIALDGFTGFTPVQYHLLETLLRLADEVLVTVTLDEREDPYRCGGVQELFYMSKKTVRTLCEIAARGQVEVKEPHWVRQGAQGRFSHSPALLWLERNLFRPRPEAYPADGPGLGEDGKPRGVGLYSLPTPRQELHFIAREIRRLTREEGYRYKDVAVVCGNVEMYGNYAQEIFGAYGIPLFLDARKNIAFHPMAEFVKQALLLLEQDFSYEAVLGYFRCGLSGVPMEDVDLLENYLLAENIRGFSRWERLWVRRGSVRDEAELARVNELRERFVGQTAPLRAAFSGLLEKEEAPGGKAARRGTVRQESEALYGLICQLEIEGQLEAYAERFLAEGENARAKEYAQIYRTVMDLLDQMVGLLGEERMDAREYRQILEAGMEAAAVGIIPPGYDRVVFGDIERTRLSDIKVLFFAGVNDGLIPKAAEHGGIISQADWERFAASGMEIAPTDRERSFIQKFYLYLSLTKPSEKLYMTWFCTGQDGKEARKSYLAGVVQKLFPQLVPERLGEASEARQAVTPKSSLLFFVQGLKEAKAGRVSPEWKGLCRWYHASGEWGRKVSPLFEAAFYQYHASPMGKETVHALYGMVLENSVTRLEEFSRCAYRHFLKYGLRLKERDLGEFDSLDMGNLFHEALERYSRALEESGRNWLSVSEEEEERLVEQAVEETLGAGADGLLMQGARAAYLIERAKRILKRTVWAIAEQVRTSYFMPEGYEVAFSFSQDMGGSGVSLDEGEKLRLRGRIDRIDAKKQDGRVYVKVVDYKSGGAQFQLLGLYHGLQLQLVVYLNSAMELMRKKYPGLEVVPGGMYYYHLSDPIVSGGPDMTDAEVKEKILEELKLKGVSGEEEEDASAGKKAKTAGREEFDVLSEFVSHKVREIGQKIFQGEIAANPYQLGEETGCGYCPYHSVCGFDAAMPGQEYRVLENIREDEEVFHCIREELAAEKKRPQDAGK